MPATRPELVPKAVRSGAGAVIIDLEDSVPVNSRSQARENVARIARESHPVPIYVRINELSDDGLADLEALDGLPIAGIRLPKAAEPEDVRRVGDLLAEVVPEAELHVIIETAQGVEQVGAILRAHPSVSGVCIGEGDLCADLGVSGGSLLEWGAHRVLLSAAARRIPAFQSVYTDLRDTDGFRRSTLKGRSLGYFGRSCIHPSQVPVVNRVFADLATAVAEARAIVLAVQAGETIGRSGVVLENGRFVDRASVRAAHRLLARHAEELHK